MATMTMGSSIKLARARRRLLNQAALTLLALAVLSVYLMPLAYGAVTSLKSPEQSSDARGPILPSTQVTYEYEGEAYGVYNVPLDSGTKQLALIQPSRSISTFIDIHNPEAGMIEWEGNWHQLAPVTELDVQWQNYPDAWNFIDFLRLFKNTMTYAIVTMIGTVVASSLVAYGFARFRFPLKNVLFIVLISTIILPPAVTLLPTYAFFSRGIHIDFLGIDTTIFKWNGSWLPLMVPHFFGNAYNVFLLRQYFMTIPRELDEAAMMDGAGPFRTFLSVILPQALPALTAVSLFHFFFAWNDFFGPLIYLAGNRDAIPITVGLTNFNGLYNTQPNLILAASIIAMALPLAIFFMAQRVFIQGIVITGVDK